MLVLSADKKFSTKASIYKTLKQQQQQQRLHTKDINNSLIW